MFRPVAKIAFAAALAACAMAPAQASLMSPGGLDPNWGAPVKHAAQQPAPPVPYQRPAAVVMRASAPAQSASFLPASKPTLAPMGFLIFCMKNPAQCRANSNQTMVALTSHMEATMRHVNTNINHTVRPVHDAGTGLGADVWTIATTKGDCEDYALAKRAALIKLGWPTGALRIAVALTPSREGHAVLVVSTTHGDLVLDNRFDTIHAWRNTDLAWVKIQSSKNPRVWLAV